MPVSSSKFSSFIESLWTVERSFLAGSMLFLMLTVIDWCTSGVQKVRSLTQLTTEYLHVQHSPRFQIKIGFDNVSAQAWH